MIPRSGLALLIIVAVALCSWHVPTQQLSAVDRLDHLSVVRLVPGLVESKTKEASSEPVRRQINPVIKMRVTAYCPCSKCCGQFADGRTASGHPVWVNQSKFVAADARLYSFGTMLRIPGYNDNQPVPVLDRGGRINGKRLDVFFDSHQVACRWGVRDVEVEVVEGDNWFSQEKELARAD